MIEAHPVVNILDGTRESVSASNVLGADLWMPRVLMTYCVQVVICTPERGVELSWVESSVTTTVLRRETCIQDCRHYGHT